MSLAICQIPPKFQKKDLLKVSEVLTFQMSLQSPMRDFCALNSQVTNSKVLLERYDL